MRPMIFVFAPLFLIGCSKGAPPAPPLPETPVPATPAPEPDVGDRPKNLQKEENASRIGQISEAIARCKNDLKLSYIPSQPLSDGGFTLKPAYVGIEPELDILLRAFPNMNIQNTGLPNVTLDGNQTLCFFLTGGLVTNHSGFSNNPVSPFTPAKGKESRKGPYLPSSEQMFATGPNGQAWLLDVYGTPYAYFASVEGKQNKYGTQEFNGCKPYSKAGQIMNDRGIQIISAGRDKVFGTSEGVTTPLPATGSPGGKDNQANFSQFFLGEEVPDGEISGTITYDGKPVEDGAITFHPENGPTSGSIVKNGKYQTKVALGPAKVSIRGSKVMGKKKLFNSPDSPEVPITGEMLPARYNQATELRYDIQPGKQTKDFDLAK